MEKYHFEQNSKCHLRRRTKLIGGKVSIKQDMCVELIPKISASMNICMAQTCPGTQQNLWGKGHMQKLWPYIEKATTVSFQSLFVRPKVYYDILNDLNKQHLWLDLEEGNGPLLKLLYMAQKGSHGCFKKQMEKENCFPKSNWSLVSHLLEPKPQGHTASAKEDPYIKP